MPAELEKLSPEFSKENDLKLDEVKIEESDVVTFQPLKQNLKLEDPTINKDQSGGADCAFCATVLCNSLMECWAVFCGCFVICCDGGCVGCLNGLGDCFAECLEGCGECCLICLECCKWEVLVYYECSSYWIQEI